MELLLRLLEGMAWPAFAILATVIVFSLAKRFLPNDEGMKRWTLIRQIILFVLIIIGVIIFLIALPLSSETKGQLIGLFGIVLSAGLALSSTTLLGNALAAIMIRFVNPFDVGDFVRVDDCFGRVIRRGAFHTEVQTENRELRIIPNLILATKAIDVIRSSTIMVSASVSLGYDVPPARIEDALISAAEHAGLTDPFVFITSLGDFSVSYKVHGLLSDPAKLLSKRSKLHSAMIDHLHAAEIEIVSPTFMNQRQVNDQVFIPKGAHGVKEDPDHGDEIIFDRVVVATELEKDQQRLELLSKRIEALESSSSDKDNSELNERKKDLEELKEQITQRVKDEKKKLED